MSNCVTSQAVGMDSSHGFSEKRRNVIVRWQLGNRKTGKFVDGTERGRYDSVWVSTAAHGSTIFWLHNPDYLKATGGRHTDENSHDVWGWRLPPYQRLRTQPRLMMTMTRSIASRQALCSANQSGTRAEFSIPDQVRKALMRSFMQPSLVQQRESRSHPIT